MAPDLAFEVPNAPELATSDASPDRGPAPSARTAPRGDKADAGEAYVEPSTCIPTSPNWSSLRPDRAPQYAIIFVSQERWGGKAC